MHCANDACANQLFLGNSVTCLFFYWRQREHLCATKQLHFCFWGAGQCSGSATVARCPLSLERDAFPSGKVAASRPRAQRPGSIALLDLVLRGESCVRMTLRQAVQR